MPIVEGEMGGEGGGEVGSTLDNPFFKLSRSSACIMSALYPLLDIQYILSHSQYLIGTNSLANLSGRFHKLWMK